MVSPLLILLMKSMNCIQTITIYFYIQKELSANLIEIISNRFNMMNYTSKTISLLLMRKIYLISMKKTPEGVYNAEYDCNLDNISFLSIDKVIDWTNTQRSDEK